MHKKSQIVIFVLFGAIVLGFFTFVFVLNKSVSSTTLNPQTEKIISDPNSAERVEFRVQQCIEKALGDGITLIGKQGGYILPGQPGSILPFELPKIETQAANITYRIEERKGISTPAYPCRSTEDAPVYCKFTNDKQIYPNLDSFFYGRVRPVRLESEAYSISSMLNAYIENRTLDCLDLSRFKLNITHGHLSSFVLITDEGISAKIDFPVKVQVGDNVPIIEQGSFKGFKPVRLKKITQAIDEILDLDNSRLHFDIKRDSTNGIFDGQFLQIKDLGAEIKVTRNALNNDDIISVIDHKSKISGKSFEFSVARKNRAPALDFISENKNSEFEFVLVPGDELRITPLGHDPDEDILIYDYQGWRSDDLKNSPSFKSSTCKGRCAGFKVQQSDIGEHSIKVIVSDGELADYQTLRIKVSDILQAVASPRSIFQTSEASLEDPYILDASNSILPISNALYYYVWSITSPSAITQEILAYNGLGIPRFDCLIHPSKYECGKTKDLNIRDIQTFKQTGKHNLTLTVSFTEEGELRTSFTNSEVEVNQCIPFENELEPYPFHNAIDNSPDLNPINELDLFRTNHICCNPDGTIATEKKCYETVIEKCRSEIGPGDIDNLIGVKPVKEIPSIPPKLADVTNINKLRPGQLFQCLPGEKCQLTFTQYCGNRGNACSGRIDYRLTRSFDDGSC